MDTGTIRIIMLEAVVVVRRRIRWAAAVVVLLPLGSTGSSSMVGMVGSSITMEDKDKEAGSGRIRTGMI